MINYIKFEIFIYDVILVKNTWFSIENQSVSLFFWKVFNTFNVSIYNIILYPNFLPTHFDYIMMFIISTKKKKTHNLSNELIRLVFSDWQINYYFVCYNFPPIVIKTNNPHAFQHKKTNSSIFVCTTFRLSVITQTFSDAFASSRPRMIIIEKAEKKIPLFSNQQFGDRCENDCEKKVIRRRRFGIENHQRKSWSFCDNRLIHFDYLTSVSNCTRNTQFDSRIFMIST